MKALGRRTALVALLAGVLAAGLTMATASAEEQAGFEGTGVFFGIEPSGPTPLDDIVIQTTVWHDFCYEVDGVNLTVAANEVIIEIVADEGTVCPAVVGPFTEVLPVPIGRLPVGEYEIDVSFEVCGGTGCSGVGLATSFLVVPVGDADCSGSVTSVDATYVLQTSARLLLEAPCSSAADANRDNAVQSTDATLILQYGAGLLTDLPPSP